MNLNEIMEFLESEYIVINNTPCEVCGGNYLTDSVGLTFDGIKPQNLSVCVCENCGHRKEFVFRAPFVNSLSNIDFDKEGLN